MLRAGDSFGDVEMLNGTPNPATIRASAEVLALRLDRPVFEALLDVNPEIRTYLELQVKHRKLQVFFKNFPAFSKVPAEAIVGIILAELDLVAFDVGQTIFKQGDPPGPLYLIESGRVRLWAADGPAANTSHSSDAASTSGRCRSFAGYRARSAPRRSRLARCSRSAPKRSAGCSTPCPSSAPRWRRGSRSTSYKDVAKVPFGVDQELLPAGAAAQQQVGEAQVDQQDAVAASPDVAPFEAEGRFIKRRRRIRRVPIVRQIDEMDCGAACLAMICRHFGRHGEPRPDSAARKYRARRHEPALALPGRRGAGPRDALRQGVAPQPRSNALAGHRALGRRPLAACCTTSRARHVGLADPALGLRRVSRDEFAARWSGYAALFDYTPQFEGRRAPRVEHRLDVADRPAAPAPALARARARGRRQRAADGAAGVHAGHRGSRPGRAGPVAAAPAHHRDGRHDGLHRRLAAAQRYLLSFRGRAHRRRRARLPHAASAGAADVVLRHAPHRRPAAADRRHPAGPRFPGPERHRRA